MPADICCLSQQEGSGSNVVAGLTAQERDLTATGGERFLGEQVSSVAKR
jgi:hypothetical protein